MNYYFENNFKNCFFKFYFDLFKKVEFYIVLDELIDVVNLVIFLCCFFLLEGEVGCGKI